MKTFKNVILPRIPEGEEEISRWREALLELNEELRLQVYEDIYKIYNKSKMRCSKSNAQAIPNDTNTTILYNTVHFDTLNEYDPANGRFTATEEGYYQVNVALLSENIAWDIGEEFTCRLYKNGEKYSERYYAALIAGTYLINNHLSNSILLSEGDYIEVLVYHTQGGDVGIYPYSFHNYFSVSRI